MTPAEQRRRDIIPMRAGPLLTELRDRRQALGVKQYLLAQDIGVRQPHLSEYETGARPGERLSIRTFIRWVQALGGRVRIEWE